MGIPPYPAPAHQSPSAWPPAQRSVLHAFLGPFEAAAVTRAAFTEWGDSVWDDETSKVRVQPTTSFPPPVLAALPRTHPLSVLYIAPEHPFPEGSQGVRAR